MFNKKSSFVSAALILASCFGVSVANAQSAPCPYTLASIQGTYAVIGNYGANVAIALGKRTLDGRGNLTGTFVVNEPTAGSTTGARTIVTGTQAGTYTVNCDGTGQILRTSTANGVSTQTIDDFVITGAIPVAWQFINNTYIAQLLATTIVDAQETPSSIVSGGIFLTRTWTRQPDVQGP